MLRRVASIFGRGELQRLADEARDSRQYLVAAQLYDQAIRAMEPTVKVSLLLQCGHMYKEARSFGDAEFHYLRALGLEPKNPEVLLQLGHFYSVVRRYADAERYYREALAVKPDWVEPENGLSGLKASADFGCATGNLEHLQKRIDLGADHFDDKDGRIDPEIFPKARQELYVDHREAFVFTRNGLHQRTKWGVGPTVRGIDALRGYIVSPVPCLYLEIFLDGRRIYRTDLIAAPQRYEKSDPDIRKYVYNAWIDFSDFPLGPHELVFRAVNVRGDAREGIDWRREQVIVAEPVPEDKFVDSDGVIPPIDKESPLSVVDQVNNRPSVIHRASTRSFPGVIRNVAVIRPDQLGDMVVSVPALMRLREILPDARIVGLLSPANEALARSLNLFDEIILLDFPDDPHQRQRVMDADGQARLIRQLAPYKFDVALCFPIVGSNNLLPLTGAPILIAHGGERRTLNLNMTSQDPTTGNDTMRHSARTRALVETLALWLDSGAKVVRRPDLDRGLLTEFGLNKDEDYIVLHSGSRIKFTQWPHYAELAREIVDKLCMKVVFFAEGDALRAKLPQEALEGGRIIYLGHTLPFDQFDTLLSCCSVFVGNDSGPKHLAALRGAEVVSIHSSRIGWTEWGQEQTGVVISRRVPCAGCSLHHEHEECAQGVACITKITVVEVFREVKNLIELRKGAIVTAESAVPALSISGERLC